MVFHHFFTVCFFHEVASSCHCKIKQHSRFPFYLPWSCRHTSKHCEFLLIIQLLARNIVNPSPLTVFPGDLVVCENPWEKGKLLVRRVKQVTSDVTDVQKSVVWVSSETMNGGIDSKAFGYLPIESILGRACYYYNSTMVQLLVCA